MRKKFIAMLTLSVFFLGISNGFCGKAEKEADKARKAKFNVIACSPKGEVADTISLAEAVKKLQPKTELRLYPGDYAKGFVNIKTPNIIISGSDPNKLCKVDLMITGECVIRNIHLKAVYIDCKCTIVDSMFLECYLKFAKKKKTVQVIDNCCFKHLFLDGGNKEISVLNSTVIGKRAMDFGGMSDPQTQKRYKGTLYVNNCVIYSEWCPFYIERGGAKPYGLEFTMAKTLYFGEWGGFCGGRKEDVVEKPRKTFKAIGCKFKDKKKNVWIKPEFVEKGGYVLEDKFAKKYKYPGAHFNKEGVLTPMKRR